MKNLINRIFIEIDEIIDVYFDIFIIIINVFHFFMNIYFRYIDLDFFNVIILFKSFI